MASSKWTIDKYHSSIAFSVRHMMFANVRGSFNEFDGDIEIDPADKTSASAVLTIQVDSIDTKEEGRDGHLKSPDFFNAEQYPNITFKVTKVAAKGGDEYDITGDLTIAGVTKSVTLSGEISGPVKDPWGIDKMGVSAAGSISRSDFGLTWNAALETGGVLVSDNVKLEVELELAKS